MGDDSTQKTIAKLEIVSLNGLAEKDNGERKKLLHASSTVGMFYLDLRGPSTEVTFKDIPEIFKASESFFNLPKESSEKNEILHAGLERGYEFNITGYDVALLTVSIVQVPCGKRVSVLRSWSPYE